MRLVSASRATTRDSVGSARIADPQNSGSVFQADASCHIGTLTIRQRTFT